jgi:hypothetical protein
MGFSHLHRSGMGAGDWGDILLMPVTGMLKVQPGSKDNPDEVTVPVFHMMKKWLHPVIIRSPEGLFHQSRVNRY